MNDFDANAWLASFWEGELAEPTVPYGSPRRRPNPVVDETFELASRVMDYTEVLVKRNAVFADSIAAEDAFACDGEFLHVGA